MEPWGRWRASESLRNRAAEVRLGRGRSNFQIFPHLLTLERWRMLMILTVFAGGTTYHAISEAALRRLIDELTRGGSDRESGVAGQSKGGVLAKFVLLAPHRDLMKSDRYFDSYLQVSINPITRYGALRWLVLEGSEVRVDPDIMRSVWISENLEPSVSDQNVVADLGDGRLFEPCNTLPISDIRAAVEEFCELRNGRRPAAVCWDRGGSDAHHSLNVQAHVTPSYCQDPWCRVPGSRHPFH
ncbi:Imm1 family immunity protein [Streptomyces sp. NPDC095613]|uniref:Imm1 family immunity protein n=1 Tax=Streptomyces sp. NPDC095613 TaxID=3155540 RepID=UPI00332D6C99